MRTLSTSAHGGARGANRAARWLVAAVASAAVLASSVLAAAPVAADLEPGTVVVARKEGDVVALLPNGTTTVLATGLGQIQSLAILADGTMLTADFAGNRLMGFGGRLGDAPVQVAAVNQPSGVSVGSDGSVYLTSVDGTLYRVDVDGRAVVPFASGLILPGTPAEQNGVIYVPQGLLGAATVSPVDGAVVPLSAAVGEPGAIAAGKTTPVLFSDTQGNRIYEYDATTLKSDTFVEVTAPGPIAIDPTPRDGQAWSLLIGTTNAVVRVDAKGAVQERIEVDGTIMGVGQISVAVADDAGEGTGTSPTSVVKESDGSGGGGLPIGLLLVVLIVVALVAGVVVLVKRSSKRESGADWFKDPPAPPSSPPGPRTEPRGPVASGLPPVAPEPEEPQTSPAEEQLVEIRRDLAVLTQSAASVARQAGTLREMVSRSLQARTNARLDRQKDALRGPAADPSALTADMIDFRTEAGRSLFDAHQRGEVDMAGLQRGWIDLGETDAVEQVFPFGDDLSRADFAVPSEDERHAAREAFDARLELDAVEAEQARVTAEINRLRGLEAELNRRVHGQGSRQAGAQAPSNLPRPPDGSGDGGFQQF